MTVVERARSVRPPVEPPAEEPSIPPLVDGERLTRAEFERRWNAMPDLNHAELLEGVVSMPSPVFLDHGRPHSHVNTWLGTYEASTPGVITAVDTSIDLDQESMPQPDVLLLILPNHGGQVRIEDGGRLVGAPELGIEVVVTSLARDIGDKPPVYLRNGMCEYLTWRVPDEALDWRIRRGDRYELLLPDADGITRSETFPGLWLDVAALLRGDLLRVLQVVQMGIASPEHAAFVRQLQQRASEQREEDDNDRH